MSEETLKKIDEIVKNNKVVLFMKGTPEAPQCGFSAATIKIVEATNKPFTTVNILSNPEIRSTLPQYSSWPTFPQLFIAGKLVGGCDIVHELRDSGELEKLFNEAFSE